MTEGGIPVDSYSNTIETEVKPKSWIVLMPDWGSGNDFLHKLTAANIRCIGEKIDVAPRILANGEKNTSDEVTTTFLNEILRVAKCTESRDFVIACNTLQQWIPDIIEKVKDQTSYTDQDRDIIDQINFAITYEKSAKKFSTKPKPYWLGTTVGAAGATDEKFDFPTLEKPDRDNEQEKREVQALQQDIQRIIHLAKAISGDVSPLLTQDEILNKHISDERLKYFYQELFLTTNTFVHALKHNSIHEIILGCTELPIAFDLYQKWMTLIQSGDPEASFEINMTRNGKLIATTFKIPDDIKSMAYPDLPRDLKTPYELPVITHDPALIMAEDLKNDPASVIRH